MFICFAFLFRHPLSAFVVVVFGKVAGMLECTVDASDEESDALILFIVVAKSGREVGREFFDVDCVEVDEGLGAAVDDVDEGSTLTSVD